MPIGWRPLIDRTAIIDPRAEIDEDVVVGPCSIIGAQVRIGRGTRIAASVVIEGPCEIGRDNHIGSYCSVGAPPQDIHYQGEATRLQIGDGNVIHEHCSLNRGTVRGGGVTRVGSRNVLRSYVHIAHDCVVGDDVYLGESAALAGHVVVGDHARLDRLALVHQYCHIGTHSWCPTGSAINRDVPPYVVVTGKQAVPRGINSEGLRRRGFDSSRLTAIREAYRMLYRSGLGPHAALAELERKGPNTPDVAQLVSFLRDSLEPAADDGGAIAPHRGILAVPES